MLSGLVIIFLPRSKHLLISWLQSPSAVILEPRKIKSDTVTTVSPSISHEVMGLDAMIFVFWMLSFKPTFSLSTFTFIKKVVHHESSPVSCYSTIATRGFPGGTSGKDSSCQCRKCNRHGTTDWFQSGKGVHQGCILSPCLINLYAEYIMKMPGWMKHKLESRLSGEISITSDMQMTPPLWQKAKKN